MQYMIAVSIALGAIVHQASAGWFTTCEDPNVTDYGYLEAMCPDNRTTNNTMRHSWINLNRWIQNDDGEPSWMVNGSFARTCKNCAFISSTPGKMHCDCDPIFTHSTIGTLQIEEHIKVINGTLQCDSQPYPKSIPTAFTDPPLDQSYNFTTFFDSKCTQPAEPFFPKTGGCLNLNGERPNPLEAGSFLKNPGYGIWQYSELDCSGKTLSRGTIPSVGSCFAFDDAAVSFELVGSWYPN